MTDKTTPEPVGEHTQNDTAVALRKVLEAANALRRSAYVVRSEGPMNPPEPQEGQQRFSFERSGDYWFLYDWRQRPDDCDEYHLGDSPDPEAVESLVALLNDLDAAAHTATGDGEEGECEHVWERLTQAGEYGSTDNTDWLWCKRCGRLKDYGSGWMREPSRLEDGGTP